jgi:hypothetical protein
MVTTNASQHDKPPVRSLTFNELLPLQSYIKHLERMAYAGKEINFKASALRQRKAPDANPVKYSRSLHPKNHMCRTKIALPMKRRLAIHCIRRR